MDWNDRAMCEGSKYTFGSAELALEMKELAILLNEITLTFCRRPWQSLAEKDVRASR